MVVEGHGCQVVLGLMPDLGWGLGEIHLLGLVQELLADSLINHRCVIATSPVDWVECSRICSPLLKMLEHQLSAMAASSGATYTWSLKSETLPPNYELFY